MAAACVVWVTGSANRSDLSGFPLRWLVTPPATLGKDGRVLVTDPVVALHTPLFPLAMALPTSLRRSDVEAVRLP